MSAKMFSLLVVDDDQLVHQTLRVALPKEWHINSVYHPQDVPYDRFFHAAFVDMHLFRDINNPAGLKVVEALSKAHPQLEIIAISGDLSLELMEMGLKVGAQKFLAKPFMLEEVLSVLEKIAALWNLRLLETQGHDKVQWVGQSSSAQDIRKKIASLKGEGRPVLIEGETGCGKEVIATLLHLQEPSRPLVSINVASLPETLFESEMFGHVKGAFTGADSNKIGLIEAAHGGDLFLDEIEALSAANQAKLLRVLETSEIRRVGGKDIIRIQTRVMAASNRSLESLIKSQEFREDLYFRLASHRIRIPPLRDRKEDIDLLAQYFLDTERPKRNKKFTPSALEALKTYHWPGNVRELKRICEQLSLTSPLPLLRDVDVNALIQMGSQLGLSSLGPGASPGFAPYDPSLPKGLSGALEEVEARILLEAYKRDPEIDSLAEKLQISRSSLYKKIKDYRITEEPS